MEALGVSAQEIDIKPSAQQMLEDIGHPAARGEKDYDVTYENVQAGERTSHLFRLANFHNAIVIGTGDLSELALGWATYGVGDWAANTGTTAIGRIQIGDTAAKTFTVNYDHVVMDEVVGD